MLTAKTLKDKCFCSGFLLSIYVCIPQMSDDSVSVDLDLNEDLDLDLDVDLNLRWIWTRNLKARDPTSKAQDPN